MLSITQVAQKLGVSRQDVLLLVYAGKLKGIRLDSIQRIEEVELNRFLGKEK